jgi:transaldolase
MIKIPGTEAGLPAIEACIAAGINVNVTLLFSVERHKAVINAYLNGLETRVGLGGQIDSIASVASFFVSRVDTRIDPMLDAEGRQELRSRAAIANARAAYLAFEEGFRGPAVGSPGGARRAGAAAAVGQHQHQGPGACRMGITLRR